MDASDQSSATEQAKFDYMWATGTGTKANTSVDLAFTHSMVKLVFNIKPGTGIGYDAIFKAISNIKLGGVKPKGTFDMANGTITIKGSEASNDAADLTLTATNDDGNSQLVATAIICPQGEALGTTGVFSLLYNGGTYSTETSTSITATDFQAGHVYTFNITVTPSKLVVGTWNITDWNTGTLSGSGDINAIL